MVICSYHWPYFKKTYLVTAYGWVVAGNDSYIKFSNEEGKTIRILYGDVVDVEELT